MDAVSKDPTFTVSDVNLKFNKPEINLTIDRDKAKNLGVSISAIAQTLNLGLSGQRFSYFFMNGKQYQVIGQFDRGDRKDPLDLSSVYVRSDKGELIQLDNLVTSKEESSPPQLYRNNRFISATVSAGLSPGKSIGDGIDAMDKIADKVLDETFSTDLSGESRDFKESSSNTFFCFWFSFTIGLSDFISTVRKFQGSDHHHFNGTYGRCWCIFIALVMRTKLEYLQPDWYHYVNWFGNQKWYFDRRICKPAERKRCGYPRGHSRSIGFTLTPYFDDEFGHCHWRITYCYGFGCRGKK